MAASSGPDIVDSGLVLALDVADINSFDKYENLALNSEAINSWANNGGAISISANSQIAPDGTLTADVLSQTAVTGASRWVSSTTRTYTAGVTYTLSIWLKKISGTDAQPTINLWVNGGTQQSVGTITTEWVRYSKSFTPASTISSNTFTGLNIGWSDTGIANNFTFAAWGFQVEVGSSVTDYYRTTSTTKTRGTTLIDMTGRGNNGTLTNGPTYNSSNGGSIVFDGVDDYVNLTDKNEFTFTNARFSLEIFFRYVNKTDTDNSIFGKRDYGATQREYNFYIYEPASTPTLRFIISSNLTADWTIVETPTIQKNIWYHAIATSDSGVGRIYLNGSLSATNSSMNSSTTNGTSPLSIGCAFNSGTPIQFFNGSIPLVRIYNRALTASEIQQNFNSVRSRFGI